MCFQCCCNFDEINCTILPIATTSTTYVYLEVMEGNDARGVALRRERDRAGYYGGVWNARGRLDSGCKKK